MLAQNLGVPPQNLLEPKTGGTADGLIWDSPAIKKKQKQNSKDTLYTELSLWQKSQEKQQWS